MATPPGPERFPGGIVGWWGRFYNQVFRSGESVCTDSYCHDTRFLQAVLNRWGPVSIMKSIPIVWHGSKAGRPRRDMRMNGHPVQSWFQTLGSISRRACPKSSLRGQHYEFDH